MDSTTIWRRFKHAQGVRDSGWWTHFYECYHYSIPQRETLFDYQKGQKKNTHLYDATATEGVHIFANRVQQNVVPTGRHWCSLTAGVDIDPETEVEVEGESQPVDAVLDDITETVFSYIHRSNFDMRANEACLDLAVSTGVLTCDYNPGTQSLEFDAIPLADVFLEGGASGQVEGIYRKHKIAGKDVLINWPDAELPNQVQQKIDAQPLEKIEILESMLKDPVENNWHMTIQLDEKTPIYEEDYGEVSPWIPFRWSVVSGEVYGRGPLMTVLPDIKTLNVMGEYSLKAAAISTLGVWTATTDGAFNPYTFKIAPGIAIPVASNDSRNPTLAPLQTNASANFAEYEYERRQKNVNRALFAHPIGSMDDPTKTATEISIRRQMDLEEAGAAFGRLQVELAGGVIRRVVHLLKREGIIPDITLDGRQVDIKYLNPIAQQADIDSANLVLRAMQMAAGSGVPPELAGQDVKIEDLPSFYLDKLGAPAELKRTKREKADMQQQAQQMAQAQQALDAGQQVADIAGKVDG